MDGYQIYKCEEKAYDRYEVWIRNQLTYCYYEKSGNQYASRVYLFLSDDLMMNSFFENSLYVFYRDGKKIKGLISVLNQEFHHLEYVFVIGNDLDRRLVQELVSQFKIEEKVLTFEEYVREYQELETRGERQVLYQEKVSEQVVEPAEGIEKKKNKIEGIDRNFADYNGFNEQLIDRNVRNIVQIRKGSGGDKNGEL